MKTFIREQDIQEIVTRLGGVAQDFSGKTILLTGAGGFLGRYFMEVFKALNAGVLDSPCKLIGVDNFIATRHIEAVQNETVEFIEHNIVEPLELSEKVDFVIHAAGIASPFYYRAYPLETLDVATVGTRRMLELATQNQARFVFFSSSETYGDPDPAHVPTPESYRGNVAVMGPRACYDESKRLGETLCHVFHEKFGTSTNTIRPFNVYGPGMQESDYRVLPNFASRIKANKPLSIYGAGSQTRTFCYITDAMLGFLLTITRGVPGEAYNIGNPTPEISVIDLVTRIEKVLGRKVAYNIIEYPDSYPADEPMRRCPDIRKARLQLKFEPSTDLDEGLRRFLEWADGTYVGSE